MHSMSLGKISNVDELEKHFFRAQKQGHHTIDHLEETGVERGSAHQSYLMRKRHRQSNNTGTASQIGETSETRDEAQKGLDV